MAYTLTNAQSFFETARERYSIMLRRAAGLPREQWTNDPQFKQWRFCQVHREDDKTTKWFRAHVREPLNTIHHVDQLDTLNDLSNIRLRIAAAAVNFRWFNRIETGERILDLLIGEWDTQEARRRLTGVSPVVTGAYIIKCGDGMSKLEGVLSAIDNARPKLAKMVPTWGESLQKAWADLKAVDYMGGFTSYEVISDLRWTPLLNTAHDINTWCNAGPGCARGLGWVTTGDPDTFNTGPRDQKVMLELMRELLAMSRDPNIWPKEWASWEMREVEHWNCEFDKWSRAKGGQAMKRRFSL